MSREPVQKRLARRADSGLQAGRWSLVPGGGARQETTAKYPLAAVKWGSMSNKSLDLSAGIDISQLPAAIAASAKLVDAALETVLPVSASENTSTVVCSRSNWARRATQRRWARGKAAVVGVPAVR